MEKQIVALKSWFGNLSQEEKLEVLKFLYPMKDETTLITEGLNLGPRPSSRNDVCPKCGRAYE